MAKAADKPDKPDQLRRQLKDLIDHCRQDSFESAADLLDMANELEGCHAALSENEEQYQAIFENTGTGTIIVEEDGTIALANRGFQSLSGFSKQEIEGNKTWADFVPYESERQKLARYHKQRRLDPGSVPNKYESAFRDRQGHIRWVFVTVAIIPHTNKSVVSLMDITELKQAQEKLRQSEEKFRHLAEKSLDIIWSVDQDLNFTYISPSVERILGYSQAEAYHVSLDTRLAPATYAMIMEKYRAAKDDEIQETQTLELEQVRKDGAVIWTEVSIMPLFDGQGRFLGAQGITRDITRRKAMEKELKILKNAVDSSMSGFVLMDLNGSVSFVNPSFMQILKFTDESEVLGKHISEFLLNAEDAPLIFDALYEQKQWNGELLAKRKDGTLVDIQMIASVVKDESQNDICLMGSFTDITEQKRAEAKLQQAYDELERRVEERTRELKKSESRLNRSQQVSRVATWERDLQTEERFWSDEHYRLFGYAPGERSAIDILQQHMPPDELNRFEQHIAHCIQEKKEINFQFCLYTKTGERRYAHPVGQVEWDQSGNPLYIYGVTQDITEKIETEQALQQTREDYENLLLSTKQVTAYKNIIGKNKQMRQIFTLIRQLANVDTTVLVTGESGTGKELVVEALHNAGARAKGPLIKVNCSALSESLLESELFGHVRGAFTGAVSPRKGRIESAEGGTLFLDEIGEISASLQLKLLRFLQQKQFERVGDVNTLDADVRIVAATNADLRLKVQKGTFREDLYYRLKIMPIHMPPLRERTEDIPLLIDHFCRQFSQAFDKRITGVSDEVMRLCMEYAWPGNVRELEHALEHGVLLCPGGKIALAHLPKEFLAPSKEPGFRGQNGSIKIDRQGLVDALNATEGNKAAAARRLGISRRTIYRKLQAFGLLEEAGV